MRSGAKSIRPATDLPIDGGRASRSFPGLGSLEVSPALPGDGLGGSELAGAGLPRVLALFSVQSNGSRNGKKQNRAAGGNSRPETEPEAQPSAGDGVPDDMASLVLDNSALGTSAARWPGPTPNEAGRQIGLDPAGDAAIMLRLAAGDESCFNYLVGKYHRAMIHFLFRMVHNQAVAEELAQEVFLRVYRSRESYRAEAKFTTWLYRIATNLAVNHAQRLMRDERMAAIRTHVMALPERQRMAVLMHKYQGMDYRQIGEVLKLSESATKSLLFRAYQTLRDKLKDFV